MLENLPLTMEWTSPQQGKASLRLLDQRKLPHKVEYLDCYSSDQVCDAIALLAVRGAPAIGDAGAYALVLWAFNEWPVIAAASGQPIDSLPLFVDSLKIRGGQVASVRPTAVNLSWAVKRMLASAEQFALAGFSAEELVFELEREANVIYAADEADCKRIGEVGAQELHELAIKLGRPLRVETHCNAGSLACARYGTALSVIYHAHAAGDIEMVWVDETRPVDQGARLTAWELIEAGVPCTLICDNMAGSLMKDGKVDAVVVGADRICANGDFANKIGTYPLAVLAKHHGVPFYAAAPFSTFDMSLREGSQIVIEERDPQEVRCAPVSEGQWQQIAPEGCKVCNPAFDVTPHELLSGIITERGVQRP